jgi:hypothetical protein
MIYLVALLPATGLVVGGYLVLYISGRSEGGFRTFGRYLGFWAFTLAGLIVLGAIFAAAHFRHGMREHGEGCWAGHPPIGMDCSRCNAEPRGAAPDGSRPGGEPPAVAPKSAPPQ